MDDKVKLREEFRPTSLSTSKDLGSGEVLQVLVVGDDVDRKGGTLKVVSPNSKSVENSEKLLVMSVVVKFGRGESMRVESERVDFTVGSDNGKDCAEGIVGSVSFHNKLSIRNPMSKNRSSSKSTFKCFKGSAAIISEGPSLHVRHISGRTMSE